jgi:hypothetical protein
MSDLYRKLVNGLLFNASWFLIVFFHEDTMAIGVLIAHLTIHHLVFEPRKSEYLLIAGVLSFGLVVDQAIFALGILGTSAGGLAPLWFTALWGILATTLCHAFEALQRRLWLAGVAGAVSAGLSYTAGTRMTPIEFESLLAGTLTIMAVWALMFPLLLLVARRSGQPMARVL